MATGLRKRGGGKEQRKVLKQDGQSQEETPWMIEALCDAVLFGVMCFHIFMCPFTKVEESFNVQAMHDLLFNTRNISHFDHLEFPGVVPRSFLGPLFVVLSASPLLGPLRLFVPHFPKLFYLYICRIALGTLGLAAYSALRRAVRRTVNQPTFSIILTAITISQFHYLFYVSRPLANTFAMGIVTLAGAALVSQNIQRAVWLLAASAIIFRCDTVLVAFPLLLWFIFSAERGVWLTRFWIVLLVGLQATFGCILLTVLVDSFFWQTWVWPEGVVFKFNVIDNRSSEWGTSPWHWYFSSALPRALLASIFFIPFAFKRGSAQFYREILVSSLLFVVLYSKLPHKELRFLFPVLPFFNVAAALGFLQIWNQRFLGRMSKLLALVSILAVAASILAALAFLYISSLNYPGGDALQNFQSLYPNAPAGAKLHIDNLAAISGVSRFGQEQGSLEYLKTEHLTSSDYQRLGFTYLINSAQRVEGFTRIASIEGFVRLAIWPPKVIVEQVLHIFEAT